MNSILNIARARADLYRKASPTRAYLDYVRVNGIGVKSLADHDPIADYCGSLAVVPVRGLDGGFFDFVDADHEDAVDAAVIEAFDCDGETTLDLVAWPIARPGAVLSMYRRAAMVGLREALSPNTYMFDKPLVMHRHPLEWVQSGCKGAAIVTPHLAARRLIDLPGRVAAKDAAHSRQIDRLMQTLFDKSRVVTPRERWDAA